MTPHLLTVRKALGFTVAATLAGSLALGAFRIARSMRRGRRAAFSLARPAASPARTAAYDFLSRWAEGRYTGLSADESWAALLRLPGRPARRTALARSAAGERLSVVALMEEGNLVARRALHLAAGGTATFSLDVPEGAVLSFCTGARSEWGGEFEMSVDISTGGRTPYVLDRRKVVFVRFPAAPRRRLGRELPFGGLESDWGRIELDLSAWGGQSATLRFKADFHPDPGAGPAGPMAHAFWGHPVLWSPERPLPSRRPPRPPPDVLWVVFETFPLLSPTAVSVDDFPGLSFLAREGLSFPQVYANRLDAGGGLLQLLTSQEEASPTPLGALRAPPAKAGRLLPALLRDAGYRTALFGAPGDPADWAEAGFDVVSAAPPRGQGGERSLRSAARWLADNAGRGRHFLVVFIRAPKGGEDPSPRCWARAFRLSPSVLLEGRRWRALAQAVQADGALERLWTQRMRLGVDGPTLFIVNSLRGISFRPEPVRRTADGRLLWRVLSEPGLGLREEEVRVLWLMKHPSLAVGREISAPAQLLDVAPTAADVIGVPPEQGLAGRSFIRTKNRWGPPEEGARFLIEGAGGEALILDGHFKYLRRGRPQEIPLDARAAARTDFEPEELYDLWTDPGERRNLVRRRRDLLARARRAVVERRPERVATRFLFRGWGETPLQGSVVCPGGELWNVSLSSGVSSRGGTNQVSFTVSARESSFSFETWPPAASFILSFRSRNRAVPTGAYLVSRLGLPLVEMEKRNDWFDGNKFPWMEGFPGDPPATGGPWITMGRDAPPEDPR